MARADTTVDTIVFDVGGVLLAHDNELLFRTLASRCISPAALDLIRAEAHDERYGTGALSITDLHERLSSELGYTSDWAGFAEDFCCHFTIWPEMIGLADRLAASNRFILFSNTNEVHRLHQRGIFERYEAYVSHELGLVKPDIAAFEKVASLARIDPARSIFVDDRADNVEGARQAGFIAHQFTAQPTLEQFLCEQGITWNT